MLTRIQVLPHRSDISGSPMAPKKRAVEPKSDEVKPDAQEAKKPRVEESEAWEDEKAETKLEPAEKELDAEPDAREVTKDGLCLSSTLSLHICAKLTSSQEGATR